MALPKAKVTTVAAEAKMHTITTAKNNTVKMPSVIKSFAFILSDAPTGFACSLIQIAPFYILYITKMKSFHPRE